MLFPMPTLRVRTPEGIELRHEIAGVGSRFAAGLIDLLVFFAIYLLVGGVLSAVAVLGGGFEVFGTFVLSLLVGGALLTGVLYTLVFHLLWAGQSPGKRQLGLRVTSADGYAASTFQFVLRALLLPVDLVPLPAPLGVLGIAATPRCQRLGDLAAGTLVVRERTADAAPEPWPDENWSTRAERGLELSPGMAAHFSDEDLRYLRDVIVRRGLSETHAAELYTRVAAHYAARLGIDPQISSRRTLKEMYLFARESKRAGA